MGEIYWDTSQESVALWQVHVMGGLDTHFPRPMSIFLNYHSNVFMDILP